MAKTTQADTVEPCLLAVVAAAVRRDLRVAVLVVEARTCYLQPAESVERLDSSAGQGEM